MGDPDPSSTPPPLSSSDKKEKKDKSESGQVDSKAGLIALKAAQAEQLNLKVLGQDGQVIAFKIKTTTPFRKLMNAYCDRQKLIQSTIRFVFDGHRLKEGDTPKSFDMEEDDTIEVFAQQSGGESHICRWQNRKRRATSSLNQ